jgi:tRNA (cmo5U34)-methyltransferase
MNKPADTNAAIWQSEEIAASWAAEAGRHEHAHAGPLRFLAGLLPFGEQDPVTVLDLGAGTGAASRAVLGRYPRAVAILADFSAAMRGLGEQEMAPFAGRYRYVEFDMSAGGWPAEIPAAVDAAVTSLCVHHLPDDRKQSLFAEIFARLAPGGWYLNYDPVRTDDPVVAATWERVADRDDPAAAARRQQRTPQEQARWDNHVRHLSPLPPQLDYLRSAGFHGVDVYWKRLDYVIFGGVKPDGAGSPR